MLNALNGSSYQYVVQTAAIAQLPHLNDDRAIPVLLQKTRPGDPVQIRNASTLGLATFALNGKQRQIILDTILNLLDDPSPSVRNTAITALKRIDDERALEKLRDVVKREPLEFIQRNARETLKILELPNRKK
jgi:aminopeptidase N